MFSDKRFLKCKNFRQKYIFATHLGWLTRTFSITKLLRDLLVGAVKTDHVNSAELGAASFYRLSLRIRLHRFGEPRELPRKSSGDFLMLLS